MRGLSIQERIESKIMYEPNSGCWLWTEKLDSYGYGRLKVNNKDVKAHRLSYRFYVGEFDSVLFVCHRCDTPSCINPNHLFLGTAKDNADDMVRKRRSTFGERSATATITEASALEIIRMLSEGMAHRLIADKVGCRTQIVKDISRNKSWNYLKH